MSKTLFGDKLGAFLYLTFFNKHFNINIINRVNKRLKNI